MPVYRGTGDITGGATLTSYLDTVLAAVQASATASATSATAAGTAQTGSEAALASAEAAQTAAESAESGAQSAQSAAEAAQTSAEAAQSAAETAQGLAETAQTGAESAQTTVESDLADFETKYLGPKSSEPTLDNVGNALIAGAIYYNTTDSTLYVYNGTTWDAASASSAATTTAEGLIELATQTEVDTGTDAVRAVTPSTLTGWSGRYTLPSASTTVVGGVELATQTEVDTGTDTTRAVTPATLASYSGLPAAIFTEDSGELTASIVSLDNAISIAHGLTGVPLFWTLYIRCTTADNGYSVGDVIDFSGVIAAPGSSGETSRWADSSAIGYSSSRGFDYLGTNGVAPKTGGGGGIDVANWEWVGRAYR